ncbi:YfjI family protein [Enterobacter kobei]|uniref:YfjI family protein n=1 Tax=Enterobacter kobei TaxID=208224 RepID=UPI0009BC406D|nr:YfjI family protein [Enterobacter kobei]
MSLNNSPEKKNGTTFPLHCLPEQLKETVERVNMFTGMSMELTINIIFTMLSIICQYLVGVVSPYSGIPGPCSLYLLTLAESGEGKTFLSRLLMRPFYSQIEKMQLEYRDRLTIYKRQHRIWKTSLQGFDANQRQAIKNGKGVEDAQVQLDEHYKGEPKRPVEPKFSYQDVTFKGLIQGLSLHAEAGIIMDEAISFFRSGLKNHLGLLNKGWDGGKYSFDRTDGENYELPLCLMLSLMIQPGVFINYLEKHGEMAKSSGLLARFLVMKVKSSIGQRNSRIDEEGLNAVLAPFYDHIQGLLSLLEARFYDDSIPKDQLRLSDDAKMFLQEKQREIEQAILLGGKYSHIRDFASKALEQALRLATIMTFYLTKPTGGSSAADLIYTRIIDARQIRNALTIVDWYLQQASDLFYPLSERYRFECDVRSLWSFIVKRLNKSQGMPFPKYELLQSGPGRLRHIDKLTPALNQLINQGMCCIIRFNGSSALYIAGIHNGSICSGGVTHHYSIVQRQNLKDEGFWHVDL